MKIKKLENILKELKEIGVYGFITYIPNRWYKLVIEFDRLNIETSKKLCKILSKSNTELRCRGDELSLFIINEVVE